MTAARALTAAALTAAAVLVGYLAADAIWSRMEPPSGCARPVMSGEDGWLTP